MSARVLVLGSDADFHDWHSFTGRAARLDTEAAVRMSVHGDVLVVSSAPLYPHGLGDRTPLAIGMRMIRLPSPGHDGLDVVVPAAALLDRFARGRAEGIREIPVPPQEVRASWAGIAPPRGPWEPAGHLGTADLRRVARDGIEAVAAGTPEGAGSHAVQQLRTRIWSTPLTASVEFPIPAAVAFALEGLGFLGAETEDARVFVCGRWVRVSTAFGHVLSKF